MARVVTWNPLCEYHKTVDHPSVIYESENLSAVNVPPLVYESETLRKIHDDAKISTFQFETVRAICQCLSKRKSFFLGDGTGCGKGRILAACALEFLERGSKVLWISVNKRLFHDAMRDTNVLDSPKLTWGKFTGSLSFMTYTEMLNAQMYEKVSTWLQQEANCLVILDECHWLRNASASSKSLQKMLDSLPHCSILYSSATAASAPCHFRYTDGLGLWGTGDSPFVSFNDFKSALTKHGDTIMELVALHMKARGVYVSRHLSMHGVKIECVQQQLTDHTRHLYNRCAREFTNNNFTGGIQHQIFWQRFLAHTKIPIVLELIQQELENGNAVIIALQNTGEASDVRKIVPENPDYISTCQEIFQEVAPNSVTPEFGLDPIDAITNKFGSHNVSEITGRRKRVVETNGTLAYEPKPSILQECKDFQSGKKDIAILSRAGSTGISLHAEQADSKPRVHICLELPWSAEDFLQQCGRSHRSSATHLPTYKFIYTAIPAELRFVSSISQKLSSMGSLTKADRHSSSHFLQTPENWSTFAKREVALRIFYDFLVEKIGSITPPPNIPIISTSKVHNSLQCKFHTSLNSKRIKLLKLVYDIIKDAEVDSASPSEPAFNVQKYLTAIAMIRSVVTHHKTWNIGKFAPDVSYLYPTRTKNVLLTILVARRSWECRATLGSLPDTVFELIYDQVVADLHLNTSALYESLSFIALHKLPTMTNYFIQNRLLGLSIDDQRTFEIIMNDAIENNSGSKRKVNKLCDHYNRKINEHSFSPQLNISRKGEDYIIDVMPETPKYLDLSREKSILNVVTNEVYKTKHENGNVSMYKPCAVAPCRTFPKEQFDEELSVGRLQFCDNFVFERKQTTHMRHLINKLNFSRYRYTISVQTALDSWERSEKILLSFETKNGPVIGLLIKCQPM